jgi:hypothetical protein
MTPPCNSACARSLCEKDSGTGHGAKDPKEVLRRGGVLSLKLSTEVLNRRGFDTDADGEVPTVSEHVNLRGHLDPVSVSQGLDQTIRATDRHVNGACVILQRERGTPTPPS